MASGARKSVLVVEDNELNMKLFRDLLDAFGFETLECRDGARAVDLARGQRPDLIIMDIQLPGGVSGLDLTKWIKLEPDLRDIPVMAVTAFASATDEQRVREAGCEAYMSKPIQISAFVRQVNDLTRERAA
jgi:two-component system cell cycle response regulator DivK